MDVRALGVIVSEVLKEFTEDEAERFWAKVNKDGPWPYVFDLMDQCWVWTASTKPNGFGQFKFRGAITGPHRVSYMVSVGNMSNMISVWQKCQNKLCVNPNHLEAHSKNYKDPFKIRKCAYGHSITGANANKRDGRCNACDKAWMRRWKLNKQGIDVSSFDFQLESDYNYKRITKGAKINA